jgi:glyoxylase-like metal-dependent hydrolase (beta-lactamase superfamily II)
MSAREPPIPPIPAELFHTPHPFVDDCQPEDLVYLLLNVGDGDAQVLLLPAERDASGAALPRKVLLVDVAINGKVPTLIQALTAGPQPLLSLQPGTFPVVVGTHPHDDHIGGMAELLNVHGNEVGEYWEPPN